MSHVSRFPYDLILQHIFCGTDQNGKLLRSVNLEFIKSAKVRIREDSSRSVNQTLNGMNTVIFPSITSTRMTRFQGRRTLGFPCANHSPLWIESVSHNTTATDIEEEAAGAAPRQGPMEQTEVDVCCHLNLEIQIFNGAYIRTLRRQFPVHRNTFPDSRKTDHLKTDFEESPSI